MFRVTATRLLCLCVCLQTGMKFGHGAHGSGDGEVVAAEGSDAVLPCSLSTKESISAGLFDWIKAAQKDDPRKEVFFYDAGIHYNNGRSGQSEEFKGRVSHFPGELKHGNASIIIRNTKMSDSGIYTCIFPRPEPRQTFHIKLVVGCDPQCLTLTNKYGKTDGAAPKPYIEIVDVTNLRVKLKCDILGAFPQPKLQWQDSDRNILPAEEPQVSDRGGRYDVTLQTTVTKTTSNRFHCVAKQEDIRHRIEAEITVPEKLFEDTASKVAIGCSVGFLLGALTVAAVLVALIATKCITVRFNRGSCQEADRSSCSSASQPLQTGSA